MGAIPIPLPQSIDSVTEALPRVAGQFREMAGLRLTDTQAARLFALDVGTCQAVLQQLVANGVLVEIRGGTYARAAEVDAGA